MLLVRQTSNHHHCNWQTQKPICNDFQVISSSSSWSKTTLCTLKEQMWLPNRKHYVQNTLFWPGRNHQIGSKLHACSFLDVPIPTVQVLRLHIQMFLSNGLYVCIILETAHHRTTFGIFCNITKKTTPEENSCKMFHISSTIVLFSYGKVKDIYLGIRIKFHLWGQKEVVTWVWGKNPKMRAIFCKIPIIKQDTNFISHAVGQTNF